MNPRLATRLPTMTLALELLEERGGSYILETGCARQEDNWEGDGMSTLVWGEWAAEHDGHVWTVDADAGNLATCRALTEPWADHITYIHDDSIHHLREHRPRVDLLYLDSYDYPLIDLLELVGGWQDFTANVEKLRAWGDDYIVANHWGIIETSQRHAEREMLAALPLLHPRSLVLIDDADLPGGGKARLARKVLTEAGWTCRLDAYQTLWEKP